jgi:hypothetical protein
MGPSSQRPHARTAPHPGWIQHSIKMAGSAQNTRALRLGGGRCHAGDVTACGRDIQQQTQCDNIHRLCAQPMTGAVAQPQELQMWGSKERAHNTSLPWPGGTNTVAPTYHSQPWRQCLVSKAKSALTQLSSGQHTAERCARERAHMCANKTCLCTYICRPKHAATQLGRPAKTDTPQIRQPTCLTTCQKDKQSLSSPTRMCHNAWHLHKRHIHAHTHGFDCRPATIRAPNHPTLRFPPSPGRHRPPCTQR